MVPIAAAAPMPAPFEHATHAFLVTVVTDGTPASRADLRPGDHLLGLDGAPLTVADQIVGLRSRLARGAICSLDLERNRSVLRVAVGP